jgi:hypothetical protein
MNYYRNILTLIGLGILSVGSILEAEAMDVLENPILEINRIHNAIEIDGDLTELEWGQATGTNYFVEIDPGENIIPAEKTEVKVAYDDQNLYVAFWAFADHKDIRASYQNRDRAWMDDFVAIFLDTYGDANAGTRVNYQLNQAVSIRLYAQYNDFSQTFQLQPLVSYQPSPFTIFYIGSTTNQIADNLSIGSLQESQVNDRQLFLKFQYLFDK